MEVRELRRHPRADDHEGAAARQRPTSGATPRFVARATAHVVLGLHQRRPVNDSGRGIRSQPRGRRRWRRSWRGRTRSGLGRRSETDRDPLYPRVDRAIESYASAHPVHRARHLSARQAPRCSGLAEHPRLRRDGRARTLARRQHGRAGQRVGSTRKMSRSSGGSSSGSSSAATSAISCSRAEGVLRDPLVVFKVWDGLELRRLHRVHGDRDLAHQEQERRDPARECEAEDAGTPLQPLLPGLGYADSLIYGDARLAPRSLRLLPGPRPSGHRDKLLARRLRHLPTAAHPLCQSVGVACDLGLYEHLQVGSRRSSSSRSTKPRPQAGSRGLRPRVRPDVPARLPARGVEGADVRYFKLTPAQYRALALVGVGIWLIAQSKGKVRTGWRTSRRDRSVSIAEFSSSPVSVWIVLGGE